jgi:hypothetical protein
VGSSTWQRFPITDEEKKQKKNKTRWIEIVIFVPFLLYKLMSCFVC